ncbi:MAG: CoA transferase [Micrococcales bacterium]|nr:CoA transferase [Micrococcales bacterium]
MSDQPGRPWCGPLDVEGLAAQSVQRLADAATRLWHKRGGTGAVTTRPEWAWDDFGSIGHLRVNADPVPGWAELSGFFATADGWVRTHANFPHHARALCAALEVPADARRPVVVDALARAHAGDIAEAVTAAGGIATPVRTRADFAHSPEGRAVTPGGIDQGLAARGEADRFAPTTDGPLQGVRVLDLTRVIAGPTASRAMAALGADVLRIDPPHLPELIEQHLDTGWGKRSAELDLREGDQLTVLRDLIDHADVLLSGYRPGALAAYGLSPEETIDRHPRLVHVTLSAWGEQGPWAGRRGFDSIVQAAVGVADLYAAPDGTPGALPVQALDKATGYDMATAAVEMIADRDIQPWRHAAFSLAATALDLLDRPVPQRDPQPRTPETVITKSVHGALTHVPPPFERDGARLTYPTPPGAYGTDPIGWAP